MIELVYWSFVLAFTPIVLVITWRILDAAAGLNLRTAIGPSHFSPMTPSSAMSAHAGFGLRTVSTTTIESVHGFRPRESDSKFPLAPIEDEGSYRTAVEILDRLFMLDELQTPAELKYFRDLAQIVSEYECRQRS